MECLLPGSSCLLSVSFFFPRAKSILLSYFHSISIKKVCGMLSLGSRGRGQETSSWLKNLPGTASMAAFGQHWNSCGFLQDCQGQSLTMKQAKEYWGELISKSPVGQARNPSAEPRQGRLLLVEELGSALVTNFHSFLQRTKDNPFVELWSCWQERQ